MTFATLFAIKALTFVAVLIYLTVKDWVLNLLKKGK